MDQRTIGRVRTQKVIRDLGYVTPKTTRRSLAKSIRVKTGRKVKSVRPKLKRISIKRPFQKSKWRIKGSPKATSPPSDLGMMFNLTSETLALRVFPAHILEKWKHPGILNKKTGKPIERNYRDIWELSKPTKQCNATIDPLTDKTPCWICGLRIETKKVDKAIRGHTAECEHVLPVAQGLLFLSLYGECDKERCATDSSYKEFLKMEYDWSHVVCNQEKGVVNFLQINDNKVSTRDDEIRTVLSDIWNSTRAYGGLFKTMLHEAFPTEKEFVDTRLVAVKKRLEVIVNYLQSRLTEAPSLMMLLAMGQAIGRTHPVIDKILLEDISEKVEAGVGIEEEEGVENLRKLHFMEMTPTSP